MFAADRGYAGCVKLLLKAGADADAQVNHELQVSMTASGTTSLMFAAFRGHLHVVDNLLAAGASSQLRDITGHNASDYARRGGHKELPLTLDEQVAWTLHGASAAAPGFDFARMVWDLGTPSVVLGVLVNFVGWHMLLHWTPLGARSG